MLSIQTQHALLSDPSNLLTALLKLKAEVEQDCALNWQIGVIAGRLGDTSAQQKAWSSLMQCGSNQRVQLVRTGAPGNLELAQRALQQHPDKAESWFWMGDIVSQDNPVASIQFYSQGLRVDPSNGDVWCHLAQLQEADGELVSAEQSYDHCCHHGDPGSHGCYGAGLIAEKQGNIDEAIKFYRLSHWSGAWDRADELENEFLTP